MIKSSRSGIRYPIATYSPNHIDGSKRLKTYLIVITLLTTCGCLFESGGAIIHYFAVNSNKFASDLALSAPAGRRNTRHKKRIASCIGKFKGEIIAEFGKPSEVVSETAMIVSGLESRNHALLCSSQQELRYHNPGYRFVLNHGRCIAVIDMTEQQGPTFYPR